MDYKALVLDDPRVVTANIGGREYKFWVCERGKRIAKDLHGYEPKVEDPAVERDERNTLDLIMRSLWIAHLPFDPQLSYDDFEVRFLYPDYPALFQASVDISKRQLSVEKEEAPPKKQQGKR